MDLRLIHMVETKLESPYRGSVVAVALFDKAALD
jgi:hypothetical protein